MWSCAVWYKYDRFQRNLLVPTFKGEDVGSKLLKSTTFLQGYKTPIPEESNLQSHQEVSFLSNCSGSFFPKVNWLGHEVYYLPDITAKVKNAWVYHYRFLYHGA